MPGDGPCRDLEYQKNNDFLDCIKSKPCKFSLF